jgi:biopolymer transport protein ExbB
MKLQQAVRADREDKMTAIIDPLNPVLAETIVPSGDEVSAVNIFQSIILDGGYIGWFLILLSIATIALALNFTIVVRRAALLPATLARALLTAARQGAKRSILEITREDETMLGRAAFAGISRLAGGREAARAAVDEAVEERASRLFRKIEYLNVIGNISPMIGLLGTVIGMISAFRRIKVAGGGMPDASILAGDISMALVTTFWGILIAIPALAAHAVFRNRIDAFAAECVKTCDSIVATISEESEGKSKGTKDKPHPRGLAIGQ